MCIFRMHEQLKIRSFIDNIDCDTCNARYVLRNELFFFEDVRKIVHQRARVFVKYSFKVERITLFQSILNDVFI